MSARDRREQEAGQDRDHGDGNQQLDETEPGPGFHAPTLRPDRHVCQEGISNSN